MSTKGWFKLIRFNKHSQQEHINAVLQQWSFIKEHIQHQFEQKNEDVQSHMLQAISLYNQLLVEVSETNVFEANNVGEFEVLPLNGEERYEFIVTYPSHYAAYRQLNELFEETRKKMARCRIQNK